jgi:hypothetical protein
VRALDLAQQRLQQQALVRLQELELVLKQPQEPVLERVLALEQVLVLEQPQVRRRVPEQNLHHPPLQSQFLPQQCHLLVHESPSTLLQLEMELQCRLCR